MLFTIAALFGVFHTAICCNHQSNIAVAIIIIMALRFYFNFKTFVLYFTTILTIYSVHSHLFIWIPVFQLPFRSFCPFCPIKTALEFQLLLLTPFEFEFSVPAIFMGYFICSFETESLKNYWHNHLIHNFLCCKFRNRAIKSIDSYSSHSSIWVTPVAD